MANEMGSLLVSLGLSTGDSIGPYHRKKSGADEIVLLRCSRSGVIFVDNPNDVRAELRDHCADLSYWGSHDRELGLRHCGPDDRRRAGLLRSAVAGKRWLDVGTGLGGLLDLLKDTAREAAAVESQHGARRMLRDLGYAVFSALEEVPDASVDVMTMFHVYSFVPDPIAFLAVAARKLAPGGSLCIETPNARDALLTQFDCAAFREFSLWGEGRRGSEHLILHTRDSLTRFIAAGGLRLASVEGIQRYPLANHLHWLAEEKPGGHVAWQHLLNARLDHDYEQLLASLDLTDTLIAWARLP